MTFGATKHLLKLIIGASLKAGAGHSGVLAPGIAQELRAALLRKGDPWDWYRVRSGPLTLRLSQDAPVFSTARSCDSLNHSTTFFLFGDLFVNTLFLMLCQKMCRFNGFDPPACRFVVPHWGFCRRPVLAAWQCLGALWCTGDSSTSMLGMEWKVKGSNKNILNFIEASFGCRKACFFCICNVLFWV